MSKWKKKNSNLGKKLLLWSTEKNTTVISRLVNIITRTHGVTLTHLNVNLDDEIEFTLTVANKNLPSCRSTANVKVKVLALPQITIQETTTGIIDVCDGSSAGVTLVPETGIIYNWIDPDGVLASKMSTSAITKPIVADAAISVTATRRTANTECVSQPTTRRTSCRWIRW